MMNMRRKSAVWILSLAAGMMTCPSLADSRWGVEPGRLEAEAKTLDADSPWKGAPFFCYMVPAISAVRRLPDTLPPDGEIDHRISLVGAKGEFVPASFIVAPLKDVAELELKASDLRLVGGSRRQAIPAENVDIKLVKVWWQAANAWDGYHADVSRRELMPELLLNDQSLIKVDREKREHYLRVDYPEGSQYVWISYLYPESSGIERRHRFDYHHEPVADSPVLLPVKLHQGRLQQFWITVKAPDDAGTGTYEGRITMTADGAAVGDLELRIHVLPFSLPDPRTYHDLDRVFISSMDNLGNLMNEVRVFDGDIERAAKRLSALYRNQREHNIFNFNGPNLLSYNRHHHHRMLANVLEDEELRQVLVRQLELIKEAGFVSPLIAPGRACISARVDINDEEGKKEFARYIKASKEYLDLIEDILGYRDVFYWGRGEPSRAGLLEQVDGVKALYEIGVKLGQEAKPWHFNVAGYFEDLVNLGGQSYYDRKYTAPWHALGQRVTSYANPHPGAINPDMSRRIHGMMLYKAGFDGTKNNMWPGHRQNWLQFWNPYGYRIKMIYPTRDGVVDTMAWEAFREGIDDIRYATKLKMLAANAIDSGDVDATYVAKKALLWLELHDEKSADLNAMRMEMINYILRLKSLLEA